MRTTSAALFALSLAVQQAAANVSFTHPLFVRTMLIGSSQFDWTGAPAFACPSNTDNQCTDQQKSGFDWSGLKSGDNVGRYGGLNFGGFTCANSLGKRGLVARTGFQVGATCI